MKKSIRFLLSAVRKPIRRLASMERDHLQENAEYAVNNVKYQVSASFQTPDDKIPAEDFADKLKRLILSEDIMNRNGKK